MNTVEVVRMNGTYEISGPPRFQNQVSLQSCGYSVFKVLRQLHDAIVLLVRLANRSNRSQIPTNRIVDRGQWQTRQRSLIRIKLRLLQGEQSDARQPKPSPNRNAFAGSRFVHPAFVDEQQFEQITHGQRFHPPNEHTPNENGCDFNRQRLIGRVW